MSIIQSYKDKLKEAETAKKVVESSMIDNLDKRYILSNLDNQIREYERRLDNLTSIGSSSQCSECNHWIKDEESESATVVEGCLVCRDCSQLLNKIMLTQEAEQRWGLPIGTIKQDCRRGNLDFYIENGFIRKSGRYWIIHELVGKHHYSHKNP